MSIRIWWKQNDTLGQVYISEVKTNKLEPNQEAVSYLRSCTWRETLGFHGHLTRALLPRSGAKRHPPHLSSMWQSTLKKVTRTKERESWGEGQGKSSWHVPGIVPNAGHTLIHGLLIASSCYRPVLQVKTWRHSQATYLV